VQAEEIVRRLSDQELARLELRDLAIREGWYRSERYRQELRDIETQTPRLREQIGELAYDRYLFATGRPNRVRVAAVIEGSEAERAGLLPGDVIMTYAEAPMFDGSDVRGATTAGERGEMVPVQVMRGGSLTEAWLPRGPMGVRLDPVRIDPDA
jgi:S1-C subfamily serine protease